MIEKHIKASANSDKRYGNYFLAFEEENANEEQQDPNNNELVPEEAPEDNNYPSEELIPPAPIENEGDNNDTEGPKFHKNMKIIEIKPRNYNRFDIPEADDDIQGDMNSEDRSTTIYQAPEDNDSVPPADGGEMPPADPNAPPMDGDTNQGDLPPTDAPIPVDDDPNNIVIDTDGELDTSVPNIDTEPEDFSIEDDDMMDDPNTPPMDGSVPPTEDGGEMPPADPNAPPMDGENPAPAAQGPGLEYNSTRKYVLFKNFVSLSNAIDNYINKLEMRMGNDTEETILYKNATDKLREINDLCYDYITMKFEISSYVQSLLFFQNLVVMIQMVFDLISQGNNKLKNINNKKKH